MANSIIKNIFREAEVIDKASHPYLYDDAIIIRNGGVANLIIRGLKDIPVGVYTTIFTLPLDYRPIGTDRVYDLIVPSSTGNNFASLRVSIRTNGNVDVYVYYVDTSDRIKNVSNTLTFAV